LPIRCLLMHAILLSDPLLLAAAVSLPRLRGQSQELMKQLQAYVSRTRNQIEYLHRVTTLTSFSSTSAFSLRMKCWLSSVCVTASKIWFRMLANCVFRSSKGINFCIAIAEARFVNCCLLQKISTKNSLFSPHTEDRIIDAFHSSSIFGPLVILKNEFASRNAQCTTERFVN